MASFFPNALILIYKNLPLKLETAVHGGTCLQFQLLRKLRQENSKFETSLSNLVRPCLKIKLKVSKGIAQW
jgi:hypothetical protein